MGRREKSLVILGERGRRGQALIETALVLPLLLVLAFGVIGAGRVTQARMGVDAAAQEVVRSAALAPDAGSALDQGLARGQAVAQGYGLTNGTLQLGLNLGTFEPGGQIEATASYTVSFDDLPLLSWARLPLSSTHVERLDLYRSRWTSGNRG